MIVERGHRLGNHTFNHILGFEYRSKNYLANTDKANELIHTNLDVYKRQYNNPLIFNHPQSVPIPALNI